MSILPWWWRWAALGLLCAAVGVTVGVKVHAHDKIALDALQARYDAFVSQTAYAGKLAQISADKQKAADQQAKEQADAENARSTADLKRTIASLRIAADRARGSIVPAAPAGAKRPDLACFDRTELESAIGVLVGRIRGLAEEGDQTAVDLATARAWAAVR